MRPVPPQRQLVRYLSLNNSAGWSILAPIYILCKKQLLQHAEAELQELTEEFTRRLAVAERQASAALEERDNARAQLRAAAQGGSVTEAKLKEKDDYIEALHQEGERLSKKNGELETSARRGRAQLRDVEAERDRLAAQLTKAEARASEAEERALQLESELQAAQEGAALEVEQARKEAQAELAAARKEAGKKLQMSKEKNDKETNEALAGALEREAALAETLAEVQNALEEATAAAEDRAAALRDEAASLEKRLRELESVNHGLQSGTSDASGSLLRQLEAMAAAAAVQQQAAEDNERRLTAQVVQLRRDIATISDEQREAARKTERLLEEVASSRSLLADAERVATEAQESLVNQQQRCIKLEQELFESQASLSQVVASLERHTAAAGAERQRLQESLWEAEEAMRGELLQRKELETQIDSLRKNQQDISEAVPVAGAVSVPLLSPPSTLNPSASGAASVPGTEDEMDVVMRSISVGSGGLSSASVSASASASALSLDAQTGAGLRLEMLQQQLRMAETARDASNVQLVRVLAAAEESRAAAARTVSLEAELAETKKRLDVALEVLGERNERVEMLEEDIKDMKEIFHQQLAVAADQLVETREQLAQLQQ